MSDIDLKLNSERDISLDAGDLVLCAGVDLVQQRLVVGLRLFLGEWYPEEDKGVPYYQHILTDQPKSTIVEATFRQQISADGDIERLSSFSMEYDRAYRGVRCSFSAVSSQGPVEVSEVFP